MDVRILILAILAFVFLALMILWITGYFSRLDLLLF